MPMFEYLKNRKGVIFDLDGTIADTEVAWVQALQKTLYDLFKVDYVNLEEHETGISMGERWKDILKRGYIKTDISIGDLVKKTYENLDIVLNSYDLGLEPKDGFWGLIGEMKLDKHLKVCMATNSDSYPARALMKKLGIEGLFDFEVFGDEVKDRKPAPDVYNKCKKLMQMDGSEIVVFEDSIIGATAAKKAGLECVVILKDANKMELYPDNCVDFMFDFSAIPGNINKEYTDIVMDESSKKEISDLFNKINDKVAGGKK